MKSFSYSIKNLIKFVLGSIYYLITGKNSQMGYHSMINLFCLTQGKFIDQVVKLVGLFVPPEKTKSTSGLLGNLDEKKVDSIVNTLNEKGYFVIERALSPEICDQLLKIATSTPADVRETDKEYAQNGSRGDAYRSRREVYSRGKPSAIRYDFSVEQLFKIPEIQKLIADPTLFAVASKYLGVSPIIDIVAMWWHTQFGDGPDSNAAQFYHFDMDRLKWLKVFIYLTDVKPTNGPHCFISKSHRSLGIPSNLLKKGYARLTDEEIAANFSADQVIEFSAPKGTVILEDTRGLHKGKHVEEGDRLIFQLEYTVSMFGSPGYASYKVPTSDLKDEGLLQSLNERPRLYSNFI